MLFRSIVGLKKAHSTEFQSGTAHPVIGLITEWMDRDGSRETRTKDSDLGGTMRLGGQSCKLLKNSIVARLYGKSEITERHRHRYEFNNNYRQELEKCGMVFSGISADDSLVEIIEFSDHPWFVGVQFHPEFTSTPRDGHPLFTGYVNAARERHVAAHNKNNKVASR